MVAFVELMTPTTEYIPLNFARTKLLKPYKQKNHCSYKDIILSFVLKQKWYYGPFYLIGFMQLIKLPAVKTYIG